MLLLNCCEIIFLIDATKAVNIIDTINYEPHEFFVVRTEKVAAGSFQLTLDFSGSLDKGTVGFYYSEYTDDHGQAR